MTNGRSKDDKMDSIKTWLLEDDAHAHLVFDAISKMLGFKCSLMSKVPNTMTLGFVEHLYEVKFNDDAGNGHNVYRFSFDETSNYNLGYPLCIRCDDIENFWANMLLKHILNDEMYANCDCAVDDGNQWKYIMHKGQSFEEIWINLELEGLV